MEITSNTSGILKEENNKKLVIWTIAYLAIYIVVAIISGLLIKISIENNKSAELISLFVNWRGFVLLPFIIFLFGYFLSGKTNSYKKLSVYAIAFSLVTVIFNIIIEKNNYTYDLAIFIINLFYLFAGFTICHKGEINEISKRRKKLYIVILFLLISVYIIPSTSTIFGNNPLKFHLLNLIGLPPSIIASISGTFLRLDHSVYEVFYKYLFSFLYFMSFLYLILFKHKWAYTISAIAIHITIFIATYILIGGAM